MNFYGIRYFAVQAQYTIFPMKFPPQDLFTNIFVNKYSVDYYTRSYTSRLFKYEKKDRYIVGYFLKSRDTHLIILEDEFIEEQDIENWDKLLFCIDTQKQIIVVELNTDVASPENVKNVLQKLCEYSSKQYGYEIKLEFLVDEFAFWNIIKDAEGLYQIKFNLNAPNLFGGSKSANEWLKMLKERHNMTKVSVDFRNQSAKLKYDSEELESYRDYADSGGGNWTLGVLQNGRKKKYISENHLRKKDVNIRIDSPKDIITMLDLIKSNLVLLINNLDDFENK